MKPQTFGKEPDVFIDWLEFIKWLLIVTQKIPVSLRFSLADRINSLALGGVEDIVEAKYSADKIGTLKVFNLKLEKLRVLIRIAYELRVISPKAYEHASTNLQVVGQKIGGWIKYLNRRD